MSSDTKSFKISIPNKENKQASQLRDALRVLAWQQFKIEYQGETKGLKLYKEVFQPEWDQHEIHQMNLQQLMEMIKELGYSVSEVLNVRNKYYADGRSGQSDRNDRNNRSQKSNLEHYELSDFDEDMPY